MPLRASCPKSLESLLVSELASLGATSLRESVGSVYFHADLDTAYRACLWSRLANRIFLTLGDFEVDSADALYSAVKSLPWEEHLLPTATLAIDFQGKVSWLKNSQFGVLRCKDAIVDYFRERCGERPSIDKDRPDLRIHIRLRKGRAMVSLDLSGESLHRRGYRSRGGLAPLKENLASAILLRADWPGMAARGGALIDPMCGSGTLLIEAAWMAMDIAPGLLRRRWGFDQWQGHVPALWARLREEALERRRQGFDRQWPEIRGYDASGSAVATAQENIESAGLKGRVRVSRRELAEFAKPTHTDLPTGLVVCNPPYGERLGDEASLVHLYRYLGNALKDFIGWRAAVITGNPHLGKAMAWHSHQQYRMLNGSIESRLLLFDLRAENQIRHRESEQASGGSSLPLSEGARMFSNRLQKNRKRLEKWLKREQVSCYRLYDADMPEYAVAVDCYGDWLVVAEYAPPASISEEKAEARLREVMAGLPAATGIPPERIVLKQRRRQRGKAQYQREQRSNEMLTVHEGQAKLLVNLKDFLDTGLFLDHRRVRLEIAARANGRSFLNLFCYTGTASVHAALGGAKWTTSVDLSPRYLQWTRENLSLNGMSEARHHTIEADCVEWLKESDKSFDLILLDPPTFSNSKRTDTVLDVQRDQEMLVDEAMRLLNPGGLLIFSNNRRDFKLEDSLRERYRIEDKTDWSLDPDFSRPGKPIHHCFFIYK
ncbi:MAG: bifunctional 23S rRNA (guanine(2069)-N(7))-methyltransferase RlmK/23S rRNA (guanine(2445)-N(2))-methyltransferase RlmL [Spongiibacteraceae bacterium]|nr:bifunctional 23S rRNA (guanine(2069)-N(7))-methyltransferase RlmK/23S rRNA (guanine(2445)-N(2))-methyltransferase RlmL [Spongiibacteraceae bacterium]